jgi:hypothetical protein
MVRDEYFTSFSNIEPRTKGYFTSLLISRVYSDKTLKIPEYHGISSQEDRHQNINQHNERVEAPISLLYLL